MIKYKKSIVFKQLAEWDVKTTDSGCHGDWFIDDNGSQCIDIRICLNYIEYWDIDKIIHYIKK